MTVMQVRPMRRDELDVLVGWAADEGWNPGRTDADIFWDTDPDGFVAAELDGELVGGGSIVDHGGGYGFMGFFIIRPDKRGDGLGRTLWFTRRALLLDRLGAGATIEMDGVFAMEHFYAAGGFVLQHRDLRFEGTGRDLGPGARSSGAGDVVDLSSVPFEVVAAYDERHFPVPRPGFLRPWLAIPGGQSVGVVDGAALRGFAVSRPCHVGHRIGPLFADDAPTAEALYDELSSRLVGEPVFLDVPERNAAAMDLVRRRDMVEVFGCAHMTFGPPRPLPWDEIYGVTTFELG